MAPQTRNQTQRGVGQALLPGLSNARAARDNSNYEGPRTHPYSLGLTLVYDSDDQTDGDVSDFDLDQVMHVEIGEASENESEPAVEIRLDDEDEEMKDLGEKNDADTSSLDIYDASPRASRALDGGEEIDDDDTIAEFSVGGQEVEEDDGASISDLDLGGLEEKIDDDATIIDEEHDDDPLGIYTASPLLLLPPPHAPGLRVGPEFAQPNLPAAAEQHNQHLQHHSNEIALPLNPSPFLSQYQSPSLSQEPVPASPAFNCNPSHFERTYRGVTTVWSVADWEEQGAEVEAAEARAEARKLFNERRWHINGGRGRISRRRAWKKANGGRARGANGRFE